MHKTTTHNSGDTTPPTKTTANPKPPDQVIRAANGLLLNPDGTMASKSQYDEWSTKCLRLPNPGVGYPDGCRAFFKTHSWLDSGAHDDSTPFLQTSTIGALQDFFKRYADKLGDQPLSVTLTLRESVVVQTPSGILGANVSAAAQLDIEARELGVGDNFVRAGKVLAGASALFDFAGGASAQATYDQGRQLDPLTRVERMAGRGIIRGSSGYIGGVLGGGAGGLLCGTLGFETAGLGCLVTAAIFAGVGGWAGGRVSENVVEPWVVHLIDH